MANPWYAFYPGDYGRDTAHLSLVEDGAYRRLLDHYYTIGRALPRDLDRLFRICRAFTLAEQEAVRSVLQQFFVLEGDLYCQRRADRELVRQSEFKARLSEGARKTNLKRWGSSPSDSHSESPSDSHSDSPSARISQPHPHPHPSSQSQKSAPDGARTKRGNRIPEDFGVTEADRQFALENDLPNPDSEIGAFRDYWRGVSGSRGVKLDWPATFRNWLRKAAEINPSRKGPSNGTYHLNKAEQRTQDNLAALEEAKRSMGIGATDDTRRGNGRVINAQPVADLRGGLR